MLDKGFHLSARLLCRLGQVVPCVGRAPPSFFPSASGQIMLRWFYILHVLDLALLFLIGGLDATVLQLFSVLCLLLTYMCSFLL